MNPIIYSSYILRLLQELSPVALRDSVRTTEQTFFSPTPQSTKFLEGSRWMPWLRPYHAVVFVGLLSDLFLFEVVKGISIPQGMEGCGRVEVLALLSVSV